MRYLPVVILFLFSHIMVSQIPNDELVYAKIIDHLGSIFNFDYYHPKLKHINTRDLVKTPDKIYNLVDPATYESYTMTGIDLKIKSDSINLVEARLFKQRVNFLEGLFVIRNQRESTFHKNVAIQEYIELVSYPNPQELKEFDFNKFKKGRIGQHEIKQYTEANDLMYKYATKAYLSFSSVVWDKSKKYCLVESGFTHRPMSGGGALVIMEYSSNQLRIIKCIGLWES